MKKSLLLIVKISVTAGLLAYILAGINLSLLLKIALESHIGLILLGLALFGIVSMLTTLRWKLLIETQGVNFPFSRLIKLFYIGLFFNNAMPGLTGGDVIRAFYVAQEIPTRKTEAAVSVFADRLVGALALLFIGCVSLSLNIRNPQLKNAAIPILAILIFIFLCLLLLVSRKAITNISLFARIMDLLPYRQTFSRACDAFCAYRSHLPKVFLCFLLSLAIQGITITMIWAVGLSFPPHSASFHHYLLFIPIISLISALPISISGLGVGEQLFIYLFGLVGSTSETSLMISFVTRLIILCWSLPGLLFYLRGVRVSS